jgi:ribosomal protein L12E/L44/L45/RPP1/RPP2
MFHRKARKSFMSISEYNDIHGTSIPEDHEVEAAFHKDLKYKRMVGTHPLKLPLYDVASGLGVEAAPAKVEEVAKAMEEVSLEEEVEEEQFINAAVPAPKPKRKLARRKRFGTRISMKPSAMNTEPQRMEMDASDEVVEVSMEKKKDEKKHNRTGKIANPMGGREQKEAPAAFDVEVVRKFYEEKAPEFLENNDVEEVVDEWNEHGDAEGIRRALREKYDSAPGDCYAMSDVTKFYEKNDASFLEKNDIHQVMDEWAATSEDVDALLKQRYNETPNSMCDEEKVQDTRPWTADNIAKFYREHAPEKLEERSAGEIADEWNECRMSDVVSACMEAYEAHPEINRAFELRETNIEKYRRLMRETGVKMNSLKVIHFVPADGNFSSDFNAHAVKARSGTVAALKEGKLGPFTFMDGTKRSFNAINSNHVDQFFNRCARNKTGPYFIEVE